MNIYESINAIMQEIPAIGKEKKNQQQGFLYRGIDDVMTVMQPLLAKYKVFIVPRILEQQREDRLTGNGRNLIYSICKIEFSFYAEDGSSIAAVTIGEGMDSGDKATNKAMSIALKYVLFQVFCIPTEEMPDADADTPPESKPAAAYKCEQCGKPIAAGKTKDGKIISPAQVAELSKKKYGRILCTDCMRHNAAK